MNPITIITCLVLAVAGGALGYYLAPNFQVHPAITTSIGAGIGIAVGAIVKSVVSPKDSYTDIGSG
jgi:hypothetical protein